jgi:hypothetical protein
MGDLTYVLDRPIVRAAGVVLVVAVAADTADGTQDHDFDGTLKIIEALASAPSSGPQFSPSHVWVENTIIGGDHDVIPPERADFGELFDRMRRPTDPSSGSVILRGWHARST